MKAYIHYIFIVALFIVAGSVSAQVSNSKQIHLVGSNGKDHWNNPVDSVMYHKQMDLYTGRREEIYSNWLKESAKYYPMMNAAWSYCQQACPDQYQLYQDGLNLNRIMLSKSTTHADTAKYLQKIMDVFDLRLANLDSTNAASKKAMFRSSKPAIEMLKIYEWDKRGCDSITANSDEHLEEVYNKYLPIVEGLQRDWDNGNMVAAGDLKPQLFSDFFYASSKHYEHYANAFNNDTTRQTYVNAIVKEKTAERNALTQWLKDYKDSLNIPTTYKTSQELEQIKFLNNQLRHVRDSIYSLRDSIHAVQDSLVDTFQKNSMIGVRQAQSTINNQYNFIAKLVDTQKSSLGKDFKREEGMSEADYQSRLDSLREEVGKPYDDLMSYCNESMKSLQINLDENELGKLEMKYGDELDTHKDSLNWLFQLRQKCLQTNDFAEDDPFYERINSMYEDCNRKYGQEGTSRKSDFYYMAMDQIRKIQLNKTSAQEQINILQEANKYLSQAIQDDPGRTSDYQSLISKYKKNIAQIQQNTNANAKAKAEYDAYMKKKKAEEDFWKGKK